MRILLLLLALTLAALAFEPGPPLVRVWQSEDGLPGNVVRSIVKSSDGYLWIATAEGITRFDGMEFEPVEPEGELRRIRFAFWRLFGPSDGSVWVATFQGGLFRIHERRLQGVLDNLRTPNPPLVSQVVTSSSGSILFRRGESIYEMRSGRPEPVEPTAEILARFDKDLAEQTKRGRSMISGEPPRLESRRGTIWQGDPHFGILVTSSEGRPIPLQIPGFAPPYSANEFLEDREGNVWIASPVHGLIRARPHRVSVLTSHDGLSENSVFALMQDRQQRWWIANRRSGLDLWENGKATHLDLQRTGRQRPVSSLFEDRTGRLWIATRSGSVYLKNGQKFEPQFTRTQTPSKVRSMAEDSAGRIWFAGEQGIAVLEDDRIHSFGADRRWPGGDVTIVTRGSVGESMWLGTSDGRIYRADGMALTDLHSPDTMRHRWVSGIRPVSPHEVWVTTLGGGLFLWNGKSWHQFDGNDGLPDDRLTGVLEDGRGHLWLGSLGGILRANQKELVDRSKNPAHPLHWLRLDRTDGLPTRECIGGFQPSIWKSRDGEFWFPTFSGIVRVRPEEIEVNPVPPPVNLTGLRLNGQPAALPASLLEAGPGRTGLEFHFTGLSYAAPEKVTYRTRLLGLETDRWREIGSQRVASYEAVPPGHYRFQVIAVNGDGIWSSRPAELPIHIRAHFWQTPWFLATASALLIAIAAATGWFIARVRMKRRIQLLKLRNAREAERSRIARDLHDDLGASLTEISILSALAAEDSSAEPAIRQSLHQLAHKAKSVVGTLDEIVWAVNPREDTLRSLVEYLAAFSREFLENASIQLRTDLPRPLPDLPLEASVRHSLFLATREALNNLVKHSQASLCRLSISLDDSLLAIRIEDNGLGFDLTQQPRGYGVGNLKERMNSCGGDASVESAPLQGTRVILTLPLHRLSAVSHPS